MGGWRPLPTELPPEVRHFVEQLRLLKDRTGLSLVALGQRTAYSKSSWQRYLNAQQLPPRQAVVALCRVAGADSERFAARWELAVEAWPREAGAGDAGEPLGGSGAVGESGGSGASDGFDASDGEWATGDDPTVPWWESVELPPPARGSAPSRLSPSTASSRSSSSSSSSPSLASASPLSPAPSADASEAGFSVPPWLRRLSAWHLIAYTSLAVVVMLLVGLLWLTAHGASGS